ncbi:MAG TPA: Plug domain-containing protein, partial [Verrucomicrobiae bacterium]
MKFFNHKISLAKPLSEGLQGPRKLPNNCRKNSMKPHSFNQIGSSLLQRAVALSAGISLFVAPMLLPAADAPTEKAGRMVVTGSLIPTAETVGPAPVETLGTAEIEKIAPTDTLALLKKMSTSFSGNGNVGQTVNNGGFGEANLQLRNLPTLIMLNGRRLGNSSFSNPLQVDVNIIPLAMIERIEVL